jgi:hypothetical protein
LIFGGHGFDTQRSAKVQIENTSHYLTWSSKKVGIPSPTINAENDTPPDAPDHHRAASGQVYRSCIGF